MHDSRGNFQTVKFTKSEKSQVADSIMLCADGRRVVSGPGVDSEQYKVKMIDLYVD